MAAQTAKSAALTKLQARVKQGIAPEVFTREIKTGFQDMPPGINGVCKVLSIALVEEKPDTKWKKADGSSAAGELMFTLVATVDTPEYVPEVNMIDGKPTGGRTKVRGLQPRKWIPCFDTKAKGSGKVTTMEEHLGLAGHEPARDNVLDSLRKLGASEALFKSLGNDIDKVVGALNKVANDPKQGIYFKYKTDYKPASKGADGTEYKAGIWENWNEQCDPRTRSRPEGPGEEVLDETAHVTGAPSANGTAKSNPKASAPTKPEPADDDPDALLAVINTEGVDPEAMEVACAGLKALAVAKGKTEKEVDGAASWDDVCEWAKADAAVEIEAPAVDDVFGYKDAKMKKVVDVLVLTVDDAAKTVTAKDVETGRTVAGANKKATNIPWTELIPKG